MDIRRVLDCPSLYQIWQAPFVAQKVAPFLAANDVSRIGRVLEIGCGPGTNAPLFTHTDYVGIDLNPDYVASARRRYGRAFLCGDAASFELEDAAPFDAVFINSLLHHLDDSAVEATISRAAGALRPGGQFHLCDLVLPEQTSVARVLAKADRGDFARPIPAWRELLTHRFQTDLLETYSVRFCSLNCWQMFYFRGVCRD